MISVDVFQKILHKIEHKKVGKVFAAGIQKRRSHLGQIDVAVGVLG